MAYWLMKSEPSAYSIDDLERDGKEMWDGVRNYQARNFMMRDMRVGDCAFFYHSNTALIGIYGLMAVASKPYPDPTQFDPADDHFDSKSKKDNPRWYLIDVSFREKFTEPVLLTTLKADPFFADMVLTQKGSRLSIQPVKKKHFDKIMEMAHGLHNTL